MKRVERGEVLSMGEYEGVREHFRRRIIEDKRKRRIALGPHMSVVFENHDTALFQIQEMIRTERISREDAVLHEIETYNELVPGDHELSATIFVEIPDRDERDRMLAALAGLEDKFYVEVGGARVAVRNETRGVLPDRTTAVHYVKFPLGKEIADRLRSGGGVGVAVAVGVEHSAYAARVELPPETVQELRSDLT